MFSVKIEINGDPLITVNAVNKQPGCGAYPCPCRDKPHKYKATYIEHNATTGEVEAERPFTVSHIRSEGAAALASSLIRAAEKVHNSIHKR
jgi:hypothetical protein